MPVEQSNNSLVTVTVPAAQFHHRQHPHTTDTSKVCQTDRRKDTTIERWHSEFNACASLRSS